MPPESRFNNYCISFTELAAVDSTNNYAMAMLKSGAAGHGFAWFAHTQTSGKGRRNKTWISPPGENIILSIALDTGGFQPAQVFEINVATALACHNFFSGYTSGDCFIKWPNDIYWRDRKAAGILIENSIIGNHWQFAVVGVGMNINQTVFDASLPNPVSLKQVTGKQYNAVDLAKELSNAILTCFEKLKSAGFHALLKEYNNLLYKKDETVKFKKDNRIFSGIVKGVNEQGQLIVASAFTETFDFGELEWVIK